MKEDNDEMALINFRVSRKQRKALKLIATEKEVTVTDLLIDYIDSLIKKHGPKTK
jgi:hypothetical protein